MGCLGTASAGPLEAGSALIVRSATRQAKRLGEIRSVVGNGDFGPVRANLSAEISRLSNTAKQLGAECVGDVNLRCKMPRPALPLRNQWIGAISPSNWDLLIRRI